MKAISISLKISKSHTLLAEEKVDLADKEIDELFKIYQNPLPDDLAFAGYVRYRAMRFDDAVHLYEKALISIDSSTKINQDTKNYLRIYIRKPMAISLAIIQKRSEYFDSIYKKEFNINLKNVPDRIKTIHRVEGMETERTINLIDY